MFVYDTVPFFCACTFVFCAEDEGMLSAYLWFCLVLSFTSSLSQGELSVGADFDMEEIPIELICR